MPCIAPGTGVNVSGAGIDYAEIPLPHTIRSKALGAIAKAQTVPQVFVNGELIGGSEELQKFLSERSRRNPANPVCPFSGSWSAGLSGARAAPS